METQNKSNLKYIIIGISILFIILWFQGCFDHNKPETIIVKHPAVKGTTEAVKPLNTAIVDDNTRLDQSSAKSGVLGGKNSNNPNENGRTSPAPNQQKLIDSLLAENLKLKNAFSSEIDKSKLDSLYKKAIQLNNFSHTWDNDTINLKVFGIARGTVESLQANWEIKPQKQTIKVPQTVFRLLGGIETGMTKDLSKMNFKANLMLQNAKGNILSAGYDSEQRIYIGYSMSVFSIKR